MLEQICAAMLEARSALQTEYTNLHKAMLTIGRKDEVCRRLMTTPGVGPLVAITFKTGIDDPSRIGKSKAVGALFGLTPKKYQSGETDVTGGITRVGDEMVRTELYEAANILLSRVQAQCARSQHRALEKNVTMATGSLLIFASLTILPLASTTQTLDSSKDTSIPA